MLVAEVISAWSTHALDCCKGGLITQSHNEIRDVLGDLAALSYREVVHGPVVCDGIGDSCFNC